MPDSARREPEVEGDSRRLKDLGVSCFGCVVCLLLATEMLKVLCMCPVCCSSTGQCNGAVRHDAHLDRPAASGRVDSLIQLMTP